jgi:serine/threonine protein kinase
LEFINTDKKKEDSKRGNHVYVQCKGDFMLGKIVGEGAFGTVYIGSVISTGEQLVIKEEAPNLDLLGYEADIYETLSDGVGIPKYYSFWKEDEYSYLALERLGPSLNSLQKFKNGSFSLKTVLMISVQMV